MAPLTTSSVMVSLSLWVLWNCRPALYSWGLRGDKRPFNSERREVTEREALREGYQSDIHHTNLSLGTGPAKEGPWRWSWACVCGSGWGRARRGGWGDTASPKWRGGGGRGGGEERGGTALLRCPGCHGAERSGELGVALWPSHLFSDVYFCPLLLHGFIPAQAAQQPTQMTRRKMFRLAFIYFFKIAFNSSILRPDSVGAHWRESGVQGLPAVFESLSVRYQLDRMKRERRHIFIFIFIFIFPGGQRKRGADAHFRCWSLERSGLMRARKQLRCTPK